MTASVFHNEFGWLIYHTSIPNVAVKLGAIENLWSDFNVKLLLECSKIFLFDTLAFFFYGVFLCLEII